MMYVDTVAQYIVVRIHSIKNIGLVSWTLGILASGSAAVQNADDVLLADDET